MPNRYPEPRPGAWESDETRRSNPYRGRDEDELRYPRSYEHRDYGRYRDTDEGESSVRAGSFDGGGRHGYSGQDRYGQNAWEAERDRGQQDRYPNYGQPYNPGTGTHRGKGPKGYQRRDERILELISERLQDDPNIDPSDVTVNVQGGRVTLEGTVDSRYTKYVIEDVAEQFGVQEVQNNLRVRRASSSGQGEGDAQPTRKGNKH